ncbi:hypothetical protein BKA70DRAFT_1431768 [Coprinopsis sp. MPI-PUGE-AT-0042]|nr:hypothetical protein BKA70DRAFT_1431768 [Coprinopsis sp. MPI-PUGE-AT-0042]
MFSQGQFIAFVLCAASLVQGGPVLSSEAATSIPFPTGTCSLTNTITQTVPHDYTANPTYTPPVYGRDCSVVLTITERLPRPTPTDEPSGFPTGTCSRTSTITQTVPFDHTANPTYTPPVYGPDFAYPTGTCSLTNTITQTVAHDHTANPTYTPPVYGPDCSVVLTVTERLPAPTA